jgi:hypothetical protein
LLFKRSGCAEVGIEIPKGIEHGDDKRLFAFCEAELWPEVLQRVERDYEEIEVPERATTVRREASERLQAVAKNHGFADGVVRYLKLRRGSAT